MAKALPDAVVTTAGTPITIGVLANDEGANLTITSFSNPANGQVAYNLDKTFTYTPAPGFVGNDNFSYTIRDIQGTPASAEVTISVRAEDGATIATDDQVEIITGGEAIIPVLANDLAADNGTLQLVAVSTPGHGTIEALPDQTIRYAPQAGFVGIDSFTYTITDAQGGSASATVTIKVQADNSPPFATADKFTVEAGQATLLVVLANDSDPDGGPLQVVGFTMPSHGTLAFNADKTFSYTPDTGYLGLDQFIYTIRDNRGASATAEVALEIVEITEPPVAVDDSIETESGQPVTIDVLANDSLPVDQEINIIALTLPYRGKVVFNADKTITYTPNAGFVGIDDFAYTIGNGKGDTAKATVTVEVAPAAVASVYANGYGYRRRIVVPSSAAHGTTHASFPLWVELAGDWLRAVDEGGNVASPFGHDLRFELPDGTKLAHEIERYDPATGALGAWVRLPELKADTATDLLLYYGNAGVVGSEATPAEVWQDYLAVWHLPGGVDASGTERSLTVSGNTSTVDSLGAGALALALDGNGVLTIADASWLNGLEALSVQLRNKATAIGHDQGQLGVGEALFDGNSDLFIRYQSVGFGAGEPTNLLHSKIKTTAGDLTTSSPAGTQTTAWQSVALAWQSGDSQSTLYLDGSKVQPSFVNTVAAEGTTVMSGPLYVGASTQDDATGGWNGSIDEVRFRSTKLNSAWIAAEHANQTRPDTFYGVGDEDAFGDIVEGVVAVPFDVATTSGKSITIDVLADGLALPSANEPEIKTISQPKNGAASVVDNEIHYAPAAGFVGVDDFTYTLRSDDKMSTARIRVRVEQVVSEPTADTNLVNVANYNELVEAIGAAKPGDEIVLADGVYSGSRITVSKTATATNPIRIRAANPLGAKMPSGFRLDGAHIQVRDINFETSGSASAQIQLGGSYNAVWRSRFSSMGGSNIQLVDGTHGRVMYCEFTSYDGGADSMQADTFPIRSQYGTDSDHRNAEIGYCYFHDLPIKPPGQPYSTRARVALGLANNHTRSRRQTSWYIHHCLFQRTGDCEISIKTVGNRIEYCTILDSGATFNQRFGGSNTYVGCWGENCNGILVMGDNNTFISCKLVNSRTAEVFMGNQEPETIAGGYPRAEGTKFTACDMPITVGQKWTTNPEMTLQAKDTRIEAHAGSVTLKSGNHTGTVQTANMTEDPVTPVKLSSSQVGPTANM